MTERLIVGKTALVTGAGRRIGRATAIALAEEGVNIAAHYSRSEEDTEQLCAELAGYGVHACPIRANFEHPDEYEALISKVADCMGRLDYLINNASIFEPNTTRDADFASVVRHMQINAWAPFVLCREFARQAKNGKIVNVLDTRILGFDWNHFAYSLSKRALADLTEVAALEFAPDVAVNAVAPGLILPSDGKDETYLNQLAKALPLRCHGSPKDVTDAIIYLLKNDYLTGQVIYVDGGRHLLGYEHRTNPDK